MFVEKMSCMSRGYRSVFTPELKSDFSVPLRCQNSIVKLRLLAANWPSFSDGKLELFSL